MTRVAISMFCLTTMVVAITYSPATSCQSNTEAKVTIVELGEPLELAVAVEDAEDPNRSHSVRTDSVSALKAGFQAGLVAGRAVYKALSSVAATLVRSVIHTIASGTQVAMSGGQGAEA